MKQRKANMNPNATHEERLCQHGGRGKNGS